MKMTTEEAFVKVLQMHGIEHAFGIGAAAVLSSVRDHRASLANPPMTVEKLFDSYLKQELVATVALLRAYSESL